MDIVEILNSAGYKTVEGKINVCAAIESAADSSIVPLCSGYRVFPDGNKCKGCSDCSGLTG